MKRLFCIIFCAVILASCSNASGDDPFSALKGDVVVEVSSVCEGVSCSFEYESLQRKLTFISPSEISGIAWVRQDGKVMIEYDGVTVESSQYAGRLLLICEYVFSASSDDIREISAKKGEITETVVKTDNCTYVFFADGKPVSVCGNFDGIDFTFSFDSFRVVK